MSFDPSSLFLSLLIGSIGFVLLIYGKKQGRWPHMIAGLLFIVFPYFVESFLIMLAIGVAIGGGLWWLVSQGY